MNNTYFILRHGQTIHQTEKKGIIYPWPETTPILLTEQGEEEARRAAKELKEKKIDLIYSSDASRTRQTAEIVNQELGVEIIFDPRLRDIDLGVYKGGSVEKYWQLFSNQKDKLFIKPPQGESWSDVQERMMDFLKEIDKKYKNKRILIVSHKGPLWLLEGTIKGLNNYEIMDLRDKGLDPAQYKEIKE